MKKSIVLTLISAVIPLAQCVPYVSPQGSNFIVNGTNKRFDILGIDYQPGGSSGFNAQGDPLSNPTACLRDAILMQQLGVNTIRVYNLDTNLDHNQCASIFNAAGIYMILDVNSGLDGQSIDRSNPGSTYNLDYLKHVFGIIEAFANFPNTLGFWAANEILNQNSSGDAPAYIRAVVRDMKDYISHNIGRPIGVGYSAADVDTLLVDTWNYLACNIDNSTSSKIDFFGLNDYEWCGQSTFTQSGWNKLIAMFDDTTIPVFFSEYGCNLVQPRTFQEVGTLYGPDMSLLSGGLVYEWTQEENNYGIVAINSSAQVTLLSDYTYLQKAYAALNINNIETPNATATARKAKECSSVTVTNSQFPSNFAMPPRPSGADSIITSGLTSASFWTRGSVATVTATSMPVSVMNYTGSQVDSSKLKLVEYACDQMNEPGKAATYTYPSSSVSCAYATTRPSGSSSSGGHKNDGVSLRLDVGMTEMLPIFTVLGGIVMGMLAL